MAEDDVISSLLKGTKSMLSSETLLIEAVEDLVKDEVKRQIRQKLESNAELKEELKKAVEELMEAKVHEAYAILKIGKVGAKIGIEMVPPKLRKEIGQEIVSLFEKEVGKMLDQT
jgi:tellurite resistance protein